MALRSYSVNQNAKKPKPQKPTPSGVACTEVKCKSEMMWREPREPHPEQPKLALAYCGECRWRGWV